MTAIITCTGLTKTYSNGVTALDKLTLTIEEGMSFGLMGFIFPTRGSLNILGESDARRAHPSIGYLHERPYVELRCKTILICSHYLAEVEMLCDTVGILPRFSSLFWRTFPTFMAHRRGI